LRAEYHPATVNELNGAANYLEDQRKGFGEVFLTEIEKAIEGILDFPQRYPRVKGEIRRCFVKRFPFSILFRVVDDKTIRILAIRHHRQRESYGIRRT
jgi:plasmid stabilization system protein ParE